MSLTFIPAPKTSRWQPGQSGNPKGAQGDRTMQALARRHTEEAIKTLVVAMRFKGPQQVPAAIALLDRGWGRPKQVIDAEGLDSLQLHLLAALTVEPVTLERQAEPQQPLVIEGSVPTE